MHYIDVCDLLQIAFPPTTSGGARVNPENAIRSFKFDIKLTKPVAEQMVVVIKRLDVFIHQWTTNHKPTNVNTISADETFRETVKFMLEENCKHWGEDHPTTHICNHFLKRLTELTFDSESFATIMTEAADDLIQSLDILSSVGGYVTSSRNNTASNSTGHHQSSSHAEEHSNNRNTKHRNQNHSNKRRQDHSHSGSHEKRSRTHQDDHQQTDHNTAPAPNECHGCGRLHKGTCRFNTHPDWNPITTLAWRHSPNGRKWQGVEYDGKTSHTTLPIGQDHKGNPFVVPGNNSTSSGKSIELHNVATVSTNTNPSPLRMGSIRFQSQKDHFPQEQTVDVEFLLDTGALDGNYISYQVVDQVLATNKVTLNNVINTHRDILRFNLINSDKPIDVSTRGSILFTLRFINDQGTTYDIDIETHIIHMTYDLIIGLPAIKRFGLLTEHFKSIITANKSPQNRSTLSEARRVIGWDNMFNHAIAPDSNPDAPSSPVTTQADDSPPLVHRVNAIVRNIRSKEELLGIDREPYTPLHNDEYTITDMLKDMKLSDATEQSVRDEATLNMIHFCEDDPILADKLRALCRKYMPIFRTGLNPEPAQVKPMIIEVDPVKWEVLANRAPCRQQGPVRTKEINRQVTEMLQAGVIEPAATAHYSQVLLTPKPNNEWRFCIDYRRLNDATIKRSWPLPNIKDLLQRVGEKRPTRFAKIDFTKGYWQTPLAAASRQYTAFITTIGIYQWLRVPMGACGAAGYFQWAITTIVLISLMYHACEVYLDDILIFGKTDEEFLHNLEAAFKRFAECHISVSPPKCYLGLQSIEYVGHVLDQTGLTMSEQKIHKIINFAKPVTHKDMKSFLGMANYFRSHIRDYAELTRPLQDIIKRYHRRHVLQYTPQADAAFQALKDAISTCPKLFFLDLQAPVYLHTDASQYAVGGYLFQVINGKEVPIAFLSKLFDSVQARWSTYEKEAYAIYYALTELRYLIRDIKFLLRTDHDNLTRIRNSGSEKVIRWKLAIQEYNFDVEHIPGHKNQVADWLSRIIEVNPSSDNNSAQSQPTAANASTETTNEGLTDEQTHTLFLASQHVPVVIPIEIYRRLGKVHNTLTGHRGVEKTMEYLAQQQFHHPKLRTYVKEFIRKCPCCQKMSQIKPIINTIPFTTAAGYPMQRLSFDTMGPFPEQDGFQYILVIVDCFTRFTELYPLKTVNAKEAALNLLKHIGRYGCPEELLSDGGTQFANETIEEFALLMGTDQFITTPNSKEENAIAERLNKEVLRFLQELVLIRYVQDHWVDFLPLIQRILNATVHKSIGVTPASLVFGNQIQLDRNIIIPFDHNTNPNRKLSDYVQEMMRAQAQLLDRAQQIQQARDFAHIQSRPHIPTEFPPNSYVLVQYPMSRMGRKGPTKLHVPWRGPLRVINNVGSKYSLQNLVTGKTEDMHVSCLKTFEYDPTHINPYEIALQDSGDRLIHSVLAHRGNTRRVHTLEFLVKYYSDNPDNQPEQWEPYHKINQNVTLHTYLRQHHMKTLIPVNHR